MSGVAGGSLSPVDFAPSSLLLPSFMVFIMKSIDKGQTSTSKMGAMARMNACAAGSVKYATARATLTPAAIFSIVFESHFMS